MESTRIKRNNEALYQAASLLKDLNDQVVYVGGRIVGLLITDIINVINGRPELMDDLINSEADVKQFISNYFKKLYGDPKWLDAIKAIARHERARNIVLGTIEKIIKL